MKMPAALKRVALILDLGVTSLVDVQFTPAIGLLIGINAPVAPVATVRGHACVWPLGEAELEKACTALQTVILVVAVVAAPLFG
jgi:hypothetical protein